MKGAYQTILQHPANSRDLSLSLLTNDALEAPQSSHKGCSDVTSDTTNTASGTADIIPFGADDMDAFQLFAAEMFDPSIFEGFHQSPVDGMSFTNGIWEGFPCGG
jgi:hypothetical protein